MRKVIVVDSQTLVVLGTFVALAGLMLRTQHNLRTDLKADMRAGFDRLDAKIDKVAEKLDKTREGLQSSIGKVDEKVDRTREELHGSIEQTRRSVDELQDRVFRLLERLKSAS